MRRSDRAFGNTLFRERQGYPSWMPFIIAGSILITLVVSIIADDKPGGIGKWPLFLIVVPFQLLSFFLLRSARLEKIVTDKGLFYKWTILHFKYRLIEKEEIKKVEWRRPPFLMYGHRWTFRYGRIYKFNEEEGIQFFLNDGRKIFFSTTDKFALKRAMEQLGFTNLNFSAGEF